MLTRIGRLAIVLLAASLLAGCAAYDGFGLQPGSRIEDAEQLMGVPAMRWTEADGGQTLVYPRGPMGYHTFFLRSDAMGYLVSRENVLDMRHFARIQAGMTTDDVLRTLGPPVPAWTVYFKARDELVWEWRYCDDWGEPARFNVLFDGTTRRVRSTMSQTESMMGLSDANGRRWCKR